MNSFLFPGARSRTARTLAPVLAALAIAACASNPGTEVTRFHVEAPPQRGSVFIVPAREEDAGSLEFRQYAAAVAGELSRLGFAPVLSRGDASLIATIDYAAEARERASRGSPVSVGIGGGGISGGRRSGVGGGAGIGFGIGGGPRDMVATLLSLRLARAADNETLWEGRATTEAKDGEFGSTLAEAVPGLARDLLRDYPGPSGETVIYKE
ncbi:MAG: DUF4136 domain-containing protein [Pseudomonadota bacterium]